MRIKEMLKQSEERYRNLIEEIPDIIACMDNKGKLTYANSYAFKSLGYAVDEAIGEEFSKFLAPESIPAAQTAFLKASRGETVKGIELTLLAKNGEKLQFELNTVPHFEKGEFRGGAAILRDITERKKVETALLEEKNKTEAIIGAMGDGISIQDKDFKIIYQNQVQKDIIGDHIGEYCYMAYERKEDTCAGCPVAMVFRDGKIYRTERTAPSERGVVHAEITASPLRDASGKIIAGIEIVRDITERKRSEEKLGKLLSDLSRAKTEWEATFNTAAELIILVDKKLDVIRCNKSFADFFGIPINDIVGNKFYSYLPFESEQLEYLKRKIHKEETTEWLEEKTKEGYWFYVSHRPVFDENGGFLHSVIMATDITPLKDAQERLIKSEEELKKRVTELEKFYEMAVGRELRMKELKKENEKLKTEIEKYKSGNL